MRIVAMIMVCIFILSACNNGNGDLSSMMELRQNLLQKGECSFQTEVTADYGDRIYTFTMGCTASADGTICFQILEPHTIAGISGQISQTGGKLEFDDQVLLFEPLTQGQLTPVIGPWIMMKTIAGGYISGVSTDGESKVFTIEDTFQSEAYTICLTVFSDNLPECCEVFWNNRRILTLRISKFRYV